MFTQAADVWELLEHVFSGMDLVDLLKGAFLTVTFGMITVNSVDFLRENFISYGSRSLPPSQKSQEEKKKHVERSGVLNSCFQQPLDCIAKLKVPHSYFTQFYVLTVILSAFWGVQLATRGTAFRTAASWVDKSKYESSMSFNQLLLCWALFGIHGCRRLFECYTMTKPSKAQMWIGHWVYGFLYYIAMHMALWVEGTGTLLSSDKPFGNARLTAPSFTTLVFLPIFIIASGVQHDCHCYLASLKKYTLPTHPAFSSIICPHYTAECVIYLSLCFLAAPSGSIINRTMFTGFILTVVSLGITAQNSKEWYAQKFGNKQVESRWRMVPGLW